MTHGFDKACCQGKNRNLAQHNGRPDLGDGGIDPLLADVFEAAMTDGPLAPGDPSEAAGISIALLIGDLQIERVIDVRAPLSDAAIRGRADRAYRLIRQLYPIRLGH